MPFRSRRRIPGLKRRRTVHFRRSAVKWHAKDSKFLRQSLLQQRSKDDVNHEASRIEELNLRLFRQNQSIVEANEKLRKQALLLSEENRILQSQLQENLRLQLQASETK